MISSFLFLSFLIESKYLVFSVLYLALIQLRIEHMNMCEGFIIHLTDLELISQYYINEVLINRL